MNLISLTGNACDENDCQDDYDEIDDVIARGGPRFACRYCSVVSLSVLASQIAREAFKVTWSYPQGGQWNREGVISKNANRDICALQTATERISSSMSC